MFGQTFSLSDIPQVLILAFLEVLLSADNAIVLGVIASRLPPSLRNRALFIGFVSAWVFRLIGIAGIAFFLEYKWLQLLGSLYLLYLAAHHFLKTKKNNPLLPKTVKFWQTILMIELFDLAFAIDSIVAGVAFIGVSPENTPFHPKLWIVYVGGMIGVFTIRYATRFFISLIHHFPRLEHAAFCMIGWIGLKIGILALSVHIPYFDLIFWTILIFLFLVGLTKRRSHV